MSLSEENKICTLSEMQKLLDDLLTTDPNKVIEYFIQFLKRNENCNLNFLVNRLTYDSPETKITCLKILTDISKMFDIKEKMYYIKLENKLVRIIKDSKEIVYLSACKLINNISDDFLHANKLYDAGIVKALHQLLKISRPNEIDIPLYLIINEILRKLCKNFNCRKEMLRLEIVSRVFELFYTIKTTLNTEQTYIVLMNACLQTIFVFLTTMDFHCCKQLMAGNKEIFNCLITCGINNNEYAIKCIYKFCQTECLNILMNFNIIELFINNIKSYQLPLSKEICKILFVFCRKDSWNRFVTHNGTQLIEELLKNPKFEKYYDILLCALMHLFIMNNDMMEKDKIILILKQALKRMDKYLHKIRKNLGYDNRNLFKDEKYRKELEKKLICFKHIHLPFLNERFEEDDSLKHDENVSEKMEIDIGGILDTDREVVASSSEEMQIDIDGFQKVPGEIFFGSSKETETTLSSDSFSTDRKVIPSCEHTITLRFLSFVINNISTSTTNIYDYSFVEILLVIIEFTRNKIAMDILANIIRNSTIVLQLIKRGIMYQMYQLYTQHRLERIRNLLIVTMEAEATLIGLKSAIQYCNMGLLTEQSLMITMVLTLMYKASPFAFYYLKYFMIDSMGLKSIFKTLEEPQHILYNLAIEAVNSLINITRVLVNRKYRKLLSSWYISFNNKIKKKGENPDDRVVLSLKNEKVIFVFDDGSTVKVGKRKLCQHSDFFLVLLERDFVESRQKRISLKYVSREPFKILMFCTGKKKVKKEIDLELLLGAALLADMYLMEEAYNVLVKRIISMLDDINYVRAWLWAKKTQCVEFRDFCIKHFFLSKMEENESIDILCNFIACKDNVVLKDMCTNLEEVFCVITEEDRRR